MVKKYWMNWKIAENISQNYYPVKMMTPHNPERRVAGTAPSTASLTSRQGGGLTPETEERKKISDTLQELLEKFQEYSRKRLENDAVMMELMVEGNQLKERNMLLLQHLITDRQTRS
ncbi:uncharacterized protein [Parasteatoda tepidariorum]|uniref:uncharacterized protein isoform X2 n=1 Tax=Parasteatoda tepidariorum TaxID=114398 RepID=UPI001C728939|nr:uncharacterized protein LOC107445674 isoform X2 [Parasteatoda tepidariorum]